MTLKELDEKIAQQQRRLDARPVAVEACQHEWGTAYRSSSGRKVCVKCGHVTDKPFQSLGVGEA